MGEWFDSFSDLKSDPEDPMPLAPPSTNSSGGYTNELGQPANVYTGVTDQLLVSGFRQCWLGVGGKPTQCLAAGCAEAVV